jgi:hypothetical protein
VRPIAISMPIVTSSRGLPSSFSRTAVCSNIGSVGRLNFRNISFKHQNIRKNRHVEIAKKRNLIGYTAHHHRMRGKQTQRGTSAGAILCT